MGQAHLHTARLNSCFLCLNSIQGFVGVGSGHNAAPKPFAAAAPQINAPPRSDISPRGMGGGVGAQPQQPQQQRSPVQALNTGGLVNKQYNSPINLYSMNSIKEAIESHTEDIAPGVKG